MNKVRKLLLGEVYVALGLLLIIIILFESDTVLAGACYADSLVLVTMQIIMQLSTIIFIPLSLYLFKFGFIQKHLQQGGDEALRVLRTWGTVRLGLLLIPLVLNILFYYLFGLSVGFFYLALMISLALFFVFPTKRRCIHETEGESPNNK